MSASSDRPAVPVAGPSTNTKEKKKSKKRKRSASPFDFENEPVPEGDMDAEEFYVDAIMHAVYKPYAPSRRKPGLAWHYTVQWHGYPLTQTSGEEPITHDMFSEGTTFVSEFWEYAKLDVQLARSTTASKDAHPSEPVGKEGDVVFCPKQLLHKWYRSALRSYRRDKRANKLRLAKHPDDRTYKKEKEDLIWWVKRTIIDIGQLAQECGEKGIPLLPEDSESEGSGSDQEEKRKQEDEEKRKKRKKKHKEGKKDRPATATTSPLVTSGPDSVEAAAASTKKHDKGKVVERQKEKSPEKRQRSWSPGLFDGGSPGSKAKEKRRQELERLKKVWEEKKALEGAGKGSVKTRPAGNSAIEPPKSAPAAASAPATASAPKQKRIIVLSDSNSSDISDEEPLTVAVAKYLKPVQAQPKEANPTVAPIPTPAPVPTPGNASAQPLFDDREEPEEDVIDLMMSEGDSAPDKSASKNFTTIWQRDVGTTAKPATPKQATTPPVPVVASTKQMIAPPVPSPSTPSTKQVMPSPGPVAALTSETARSQLVPRTSNPAKASVVPARRTPKAQQKMLCEVNIRLEGMTQRTALFEADMMIQSALSMVNPQDLFEGQLKRLVISRILDFHVNQDMLSHRMILAHAAFSAPPTSNVASTNRRISELLAELGNADMGEGLALAVTKRGVVAILYSTGSLFTDIVKPPASLRESHGLLATFLAFDHQEYYKTPEAAVSAFGVLKKVIPAAALHPNIILGSLGFTLEFFRRLRGRKVTVIARAFRSKIEDGLSRSQAVQVGITENPDTVILDEDAVRELCERRGVRDLAERGTEFWVYGATIPPKNNPFWAPARIFQMEGGVILLLASWLLANPNRALSLATRVKQTPGWTAIITIQTVFLLFQVVRRDSMVEWDTKFAATELLSVLPHLDIRFPLPRSHQEIQRVEGIQAWSKATTSQERLRVAAAHRHIGFDPISLDIITDLRVHLSKQLAEVDRAAESDMIRRLDQKSSATSFKRMLILDSDSKITQPIRHVDAKTFDRFLDTAQFLPDLAVTKL